MRLSSIVVAIVALSPIHCVSGFAHAPRHAAATSTGPRNTIDRRRTQSRSARRQSTLLSSTADEGEGTATATITKKKRRLGLVTFDLDDTLYPIAPVLDEANAAFSTAMSNFGYVGIQPSDIVEQGKAIRAEAFAGTAAVEGGDPTKPTIVNHKEIRLAAIRKEMEQFILKTKLQQTADDWATEVESLTGPVRKSAEKWARTTVHTSVVQAVYSAWEMERHHAAERHLYSEAIPALKQIQSDHPEAVVGAVTDGSANPMLMVFSLMPMFDFSISWEDNIASNFQELSEVDGSDDLSWIYRLTLEKGKEMSMLTNEIRKGNVSGDEKDADDAEWVWIHVGDDLAYDVGGAATNGAKTILVELAPEYGQTARMRMKGELPKYATESMEQLAQYREMGENARGKVDKVITHLSQLPEAINELMEEGEEE